MTHEIRHGARAEVAQLFSGHRHWRTTIEAVLEGQYGPALADDANRPHIAALVDGPVKVLGGNPEHANASRFVSSIFASGPSLVWVPSEQWRTLLHSVHGKEMQDRPRFSYSADTLCTATLEEHALAVPSGFMVRLIDLSLAERIQEQTPANMFTELDFQSPQDFVDRGIGVCATTTEGKVVCVAYSQRLASCSVDISIETQAEFRRRGLATAVSAAFILHCLKLGIKTPWDTPTEPSCRLAETLGYTNRQTYMTYLVRDQD